MEEILDFSQTQRIVFLIDLHPLLYLENSTPYITSILRSVRALLTFPSLSSSLFAFKLFFSSLSPLLSSSKLHHLLGKSTSSFSFDRPSDTLLHLSETLNSLPALLSEALISPPRASFTASSLHQLFHDYAWEYPLQDLIGKANGLNVVRSNMILLFSPISRSLKCLSDFMNVGIDDETLVSFHTFSDKFVKKFGTLSEGFIDRDIHFSWIDVNYEQDIQEQSVERDNIPALGFLERGIKSLGWGFCSTDAIVLGSALIPFGLIYPNIGCYLKGFNYNNCRNTARAELSLQISDVRGRPLDCKCCDLEMLDLKQLARQRSDDVMGVVGSGNSDTGDSGQEESLWRNLGDGITKIQITEVRRNNKSSAPKGCFGHFVLLRALSGEYGKDQKTESSGGFFANKILEMLSVGKTEFLLCRRIPIWQLLLTFLYREGYWAVVSVSKRDGGCFMGILKPFTVHSAILSIIGSGLSPHDTVSDSSRADSRVHQNTADLNHSSSLTIAQSDGSSSEMSLVVDTKDKRKRKKKHANLLQDFTWCSFYKAVLNQFEMDLEEVYFARKCNDSKKLRFLKCWMKHIRKSSNYCPVEPNELESYPDIEKDMERRLVGSQQESEQPVSSPLSTGDDSSLVASGMKEEVASVSFLETSEAFFGSISQKIQNSLESSEVDLGALVERLVESSIQWLCWKHELDINAPEVHPHGACDGLVADLVKLFLKEPKDLAAKYKGVDQSSHAVGKSPAMYSSEDIVREYELQILLRMEMLRSTMRGYIEETMKKKMVKQICSLLEIIPYHLAGGVFGDDSLDAYVGKIIKNRYSNSLGDVVSRIYTRMDLLLFDEGESLGSQLNSEESDQPWKGIANKNEVHGDCRVGNGSTSVEDESLQPSGNDSNCMRRTKDEEHLRQLMEAQERRERARRFASFTSWVPDLQRVWAPKQPKTVTAKHESLWKLPKKKKRREVSYDIVCETPMVDKQCGSIRGEGQPSHGINSYSSVSKVLFQDEGNGTGTNCLI
ncbi:uncharacterized protein LOC122665659 [Telopea speciosissima]|uniref:uncharacterized protein LOC122665659 n=1 Tax=Telopea speciosissima TaxID=54955 RepID=UPI001CC7332C|nr:uncharacterized protein LOC122665659 [Telopea speciosissima]